MRLTFHFLYDWVTHVAIFPSSKAPAIQTVTVSVLCEEFKYLRNFLSHTHIPEIVHLHTVLFCAFASLIRKGEQRTQARKNANFIKYERALKAELKEISQHGNF